MPLRALAHLGIPTSKLSHTKMTIQGYNADFGIRFALSVSWQTWSHLSRVMWLITTRPTIDCWEGLGFTGTLLFRPKTINASNMSTRTKKVQTVFADRRPGSKLTVQIPSFMTLTRVTTLVQKKRWSRHQVAIRGPISPKPKKSPSNQNTLRISHNACSGS